MQSKNIAYTLGKVADVGNASYAEISKINSIFLLGGLNGFFVIQRDKTSVTNPTKSIEILYPNPTNGKLHINLNLIVPTQCYVLIHDITGKLIQNSNLGFQVAGDVNFQIDVSTILKGNYQLTIKGNQLNKSFNFIKE